MARLTDFVSTAVDVLLHLVKVEAKSLLTKMEDNAKCFENNLKRVCIWYSLLIFYILLLLTGIGFIMWGTFTLLAAATGAGVAALIVGAIVSLLAITFIACTKSSIR